ICERSVPALCDETVVLCATAILVALIFGGTVRSSFMMLYMDEKDPTMNSIQTSDRIKHERRQFFGLAAGAIAAIPLGKSTAAWAQTASMKATSLPIEGEMPSLTGATEWINT